MWSIRVGRRTRGSALLAVLWLSAALAAIAFALATTVRGETDRTSTALDGLRAYYLATGAVERTTKDLVLDAMNPSRRRIPQYAPFVDYVFPSGNAHVEIIPESARLDVNVVPVEDLDRLAQALGLDPGRAQEIAAAIDDWRRPHATPSGFDEYYLSLSPSFRPRHASIEEIEELLLVKGVTPDIYHGTYVPSAGEPGQPRLVARGGLADCLSVFGAKDRVDVNSAPRAVLAAVGLTPAAINALLEQRRRAPLTPQTFGQFLEAYAPGARLRVEPGTFFTLRATARLRLENGQFSDLSRTVAALVKFVQPGMQPPFHVLRWYDMAWTN